MKTTRSSNYKSASHVRLNDDARNLNQTENEKMLFFDEQTLIELELTRNQSIDEMLKAIFDQVMTKEEMK